MRDSVATRKTPTLVTLVSVHDGPAMAMVMPTASRAVWPELNDGRVRANTNMSSTPRPRSKNGSTLVVVALNAKPMSKDVLRPVATPMLTRIMPKSPSMVRECSSTLEMLELHEVMVTMAYTSMSA